VRFRLAKSPIYPGAGLAVESEGEAGQHRAVEFGDGVAAPADAAQREGGYMPTDARDRPNRGGCGPAFGRSADRLRRPQPELLVEVPVDRAVTGTHHHQVAAGTTWSRRSK